MSDWWRDLTTTAQSLLILIPLAVGVFVAANLARGGADEAVFPLIVVTLLAMATIAGLGRKT